MKWHDGRVIVTIIALIGIMVLIGIKAIDPSSGIGVIVGLLGGIGIAAGKTIGKGIGTILVIGTMISGCAALQEKTDEIMLKGKTCMNQCAQKCIVAGLTHIINGKWQNGYEASAACVDECVKVCALSVTGKCLISSNKAKTQWKDAGIAEDKDFGHQKSKRYYAQYADRSRPNVKPGQE